MAISAKKLIRMARKWQSLAAIGRKRISLPRTSVGSASTSTMTNVADKGHFVVYTVEGKRFVFPIEYLNSYIFRELLVLSEEEFGLPSNGPITLPCDAVFIDYAISLMKNGAREDVQKALVMSIAKNRCSSLSYSLPQRGMELQQQSLIFWFLS